MRMLFVGVIIGVIFSVSVANAYRITKPQRITAFDERNLPLLNQALEQLWDLTNGRYSPDSGANASTGIGTIKMGSTSSANSAGFLKFIKTDGTLVYVPYFSNDTP